MKINIEITSCKECPYVSFYPDEIKGLVKGCSKGAWLGRFIGDMPSEIPDECIFKSQQVNKDTNYIFKLIKIVECSLSQLMCPCTVMESKRITNKISKDLDILRKALEFEITR